MTQPLLLAVPDSEFAPVPDDAVIADLLDEEAQNRREKQAERIKRSKIAELLFCVKAVGLGYEVKWMQSNCKHYDIILERNGMRPMFVQVKCALMCVIKNTKYYQIFNRVRGSVKPYSSTAYDVLAVYLEDRAEWVLYTRAELGNRMSTTYTPPELRRAPVKGSAPDARDPNNWHLLDEVAESLTANQKPFVA